MCVTSMMVQYGFTQHGRHAEPESWTLGLIHQAFLDYNMQQLGHLCLASNWCTLHA